MLVFSRLFVLSCLALSFSARSLTADPIDNLLVERYATLPAGAGGADGDNRIAFAPDGTLYVVPTQTDSVLRVVPGAAVATPFVDLNALVGALGPDTGLTAAAFDPTGQLAGGPALIVAGQGVGANGQGGFLTAVFGNGSLDTLVDTNALAPGGGAALPATRDLAVTPNGQLFLAADRDASPPLNQSLQRYTPAGLVDVPLINPLGVAIDPFFQDLTDLAYDPVNGRLLAGVGNAHHPLTANGVFDLDVAAARAPFDSADTSVAVATDGPFGGLTLSVQGGGDARLHAFDTSAPDTMFPAFFRITQLNGDTGLELPDNALITDAQLGPDGMLYIAANFPTRPTDDGIYRIRAHSDGDFNGDVTVSQGDLDLTLLNWGQPFASLPEGWVFGRPNVDQFTGQAQLDDVLLNWGDTLPALGDPPNAAATTPVPEPGAAVCVLSLISGLGLRRRSRA